MIITIGNEPADVNGAAIYNLDVDGTLTHEFTMSEQGSNDIHHHSTDEIVVVGTDPTDDWSLGNIYVKQSGAWAKKRTLPNVIHTWGACEHNGMLYVATGAHTGDNSSWEGRVFWSDDFGDTWLGSGLSAAYRSYDVESFNGRLWSSSSDWSNNQSLQYSDDNGLTWNVFSGATPRYRQRFGLYKDNLLVVEYSRTELSLINTSNIVTKITTPKIIANSYNIAVTIGDDIYILCGDNQDKIYKYDGASWSYHCDLEEKCISLIDYNGQFMIASTAGSEAKLLRADYIGV